MLKLFGAQVLRYLPLLFLEGPSPLKSAWVMQYQRKNKNVIREVFHKKMKVCLLSKLFQTLTSPQKF